MKISKKLFKKNHISKEIDEINRTMDSISGTNKTIDYINDTMAISGGEIVDRKNFSIMSLPSTREVLRDI